ncbi:hypothetical protein L1987_84181 [Smallanthus sonchifolius]|uniref:Uncharacterized protein n=1 Tax=Smallanthus sonchifolius TaxID=185202 RepID=A0ACB8YEJ0_9ASTR|nr:hypothetical protein L1987_84181 [Smallanthus sonchifolius]
MEVVSHLLYLSFYYVHINNLSYALVSPCTVTASILAGDIEAGGAVLDGGELRWSEDACAVGDGNGEHGLKTFGWEG